MATIREKQFSLQIGTKLYDGWESLTIEGFPEKTFYSNSNYVYEISKANENECSISLSVVEGSELDTFLYDRANNITESAIDLTITKKVSIDGSVNKKIKRGFKLYTIQRPNFGLQLDREGSSDIVKNEYKLHCIWKPDVK